MNTLAAIVACFSGFLVAGHFVRGVEQEAISIVRHGGHMVVFGNVFRLAFAALALGLPFLIHPKGALFAVFAFAAARNLALLQYAGVLPSSEQLKRRLMTRLKPRLRRATRGRLRPATQRS